MELEALARALCRRDEDAVVEVGSRLQVLSRLLLQLLTELFPLHRADVCYRQRKASVVDSTMGQYNCNRGR